jgi:hypothetical protein
MGNTMLVKGVFPMRAVFLDKLLSFAANLLV